MTGASDNAAGFTISLYDKGTQTNVFLKNFGHATLVMPDRLVHDTGPDIVEDVPAGQYWLMSPWPITHPGQLQLQITNLAAVTANIQCMLGVATPNRPGSRDVGPVQIRAANAGVAGLRR
jgi:hypothetical protein